VSSKPTLSGCRSAEKLTAQVANTINEVLQPRGVAVVIEAYTNA
jgi:GTP cyclohydrolase I